MSDPHQLLAAYALDALDTDERAVFEAHLETCQDCRRELAEIDPAVAELSALSQTPAPPQLRADVMAAIGRVRQDEPEPADQAGHDHPTTGPVAGPPATQRSDGRHRAEPAPDPTVVPIDRGTRTRRLARAAAAVIGAAALVAAVALGGWAYGRHQLNQEQAAYGAAISRVLAAPDAKTYHQTAPNGMRMTYIVSEDRNSALAVPENAPSPGADHTYQLWSVASGTKAFVPDRTFDQAGGPIVLTGDVRSAAALGVSIEPDGGSPKPTTDPFAVQTL